MLHRALTRAAAIELVARNVASLVKPPKVTDTEIESLKADEIDAVLTALKDHPLEPIAMLALSTGARRGEILALNWGNVISMPERSRSSAAWNRPRLACASRPLRRRTDAVWCPCPPIAVDALRAHRRRRLELRMALGKASPSQMPSSSAASTTTPFRPTI